MQMKLDKPIGAYMVLYDYNIRGLYAATVCYEFH